MLCWADISLAELSCQLGYLIGLLGPPDELGDLLEEHVSKSGKWFETMMIDTMKMANRRLGFAAEGD